MRTYQKLLATFTTTTRAEAALLNHVQVWATIIPSPRTQAVEWCFLAVVRGLVGCVKLMHVCVA